MPADSGRAVDVLLQFGVAMLRAGNTASGTRACMESIAKKAGLGPLSVGFTVDSIVATCRGPDQQITALADVGPIGINVWRMVELERLAAAVDSEHSLAETSAKIAGIQSTGLLFSRFEIVLAIGIASAGFAFLSGAGALEMIAACGAGGLGQWLRFWLGDRGMNLYGAAAAAAVAGSGSYVVTAALAAYAGLPFMHYPAGFIASVLFLVPGFPLIAALFDLMQHQTTAAIGRFAHGVMILLAVASGLSVIVAIAGVDLSRQSPPGFAYPLQIALRAVASVAATCAFAMLFNCPRHAVLAVGLLALVANGLRLILIDMGLRLAPAAFLAAMMIGAAALLAESRLKLPRLAMIVPAIVIMVPGLQAYETIVLFNRGQPLAALQAAALCGFVIVALAMGLATARLLQRQQIA